MSTAGVAKFSSERVGSRPPCSVVGEGTVLSAIVSPLVFLESLAFAELFLGLYGDAARARCRRPRERQLQQAVLVLGLDPMHTLWSDVVGAALLTGDGEPVLDDGDLDLVRIDPRGQGLDVEALAIVGDVHQRVLARAPSRQERETARGSRTSRPPGGAI